MVTRVQEAAAERVAALLKLAANPTRLLILQVIRERKGAYVQEIADELQMSQSAVSHQLSILADADVVSFKKEGRDVRYAMSKKRPAYKLGKVLRALAG